MLILGGHGYAHIHNTGRSYTGINENIMYISIGYLYTYL